MLHVFILLALLNKTDYSFVAACSSILPFAGTLKGAPAWPSLLWDPALG